MNKVLASLLWTQAMIICLWAVMVGTQVHPAGFALAVFAIPISFVATDVWKTIER